MFDQNESVNTAPERDSATSALHRELTNDRENQRDTQKDSQRDSQKDSTSDSPSDSSNGSQTGSQKDVASTPADTQSASYADQINQLFGHLTIVDVLSAAVSPVEQGESASTAPSDNHKGDADTSNNKGDGTGSTGAERSDLAKPPADVNAQALKKLQDDPHLKAEHKKLDDEITKLEKGMDKSSAEYKHLEDMRQNMETFEMRAVSQNPPLSPSEVAAVYKDVTTLITTKDGPNVPVNQANRVLAAEQLMMHAADPHTIDQGARGTCNVTTVEARMFTKNPSAASGLITEVATTGEFQYPCTTQHIKIDKDSLQFHQNKYGKVEESSIPPADGDRSYASQIFQVAAVNVAYQDGPVTVSDYDGTEHKYAPGTVEYRQQDGKPDGKPPHSGDVLWDVAANKPVTVKDKDGNDVPVHSPSVDDDQIVDAYQKIAGSGDEKFYLINKDFVDGDGSKVNTFTSEAELKQKIEDAQKNGKLPLILAVNSGQEPFFTDSGGGAAGGAGGGHVVTIEGIDKDGKVIINNQWGADSKHSVDLHELYMATFKPSDAVAVIGRDVASNKQDNYSEELEHLRLQHAENKISESDYVKQLAFLTKEAVKDAQDNHGGKLDTRTENELFAMLSDVKGDGTGRNWKWLQSQVYESVADGILTNNGDVGHTARTGEKIDLADNYVDSIPKDAAEQLYKAGDSWLYYNSDDYDNMYKALRGKSPTEIKRMDELFKAEHGESMEEYINDRFKRHPEERDKAIALLHAAQSGDVQAA
ncbi:MAG TPA: hypothetical protein V6C72_18230 [Chroococcales cyanobacterium]